jgi:hypothetical protein
MSDTNTQEKQSHVLWSGTRDIPATSTEVKPGKGRASFFRPLLDEIRKDSAQHHTWRGLRAYDMAESAKVTVSNLRKRAEEKEEGYEGFRFALFHQTLPTGKEEYTVGADLDPS